jgi:hypothetical protein
LRSADVLVCRWIGGKYDCVDLTGVSPFAGLKTVDFIIGQTTSKAASIIVVKYERACSDNQHEFIPYVFDTLDFLAPDHCEYFERSSKSHA